MCGILQKKNKCVESVAINNDGGGGGDGGDKEKTFKQLTQHTTLYNVVMFHLVDKILMFKMCTFSNTRS